MYSEHNVPQYQMLTRMTIVGPTDLECESFCLTQCCLERQVTLLCSSAAPDPTQHVVKRGPSRGLTIVRFLDRGAELLPRLWPCHGSASPAGLCHLQQCIW